MAQWNDGVLVEPLLEYEAHPVTAKGMQVHMRAEHLGQPQRSPVCHVEPLTLGLAVMSRGVVALDRVVVEDSCRDPVHNFIGRAGVVPESLLGVGHGGRRLGSRVTTGLWVRQGGSGEQQRSGGK